MSSSRLVEILLPRASRTKKFLVPKSGRSPVWALPQMCSTLPRDNIQFSLRHITACWIDLRVSRRPTDLPPVNHFFFFPKLCLKLRKMRNFSTLSFPSSMHLSAFRRSPPVDVNPLAPLFFSPGRLDEPPREWSLQISFLEGFMSRVRSDPPSSMGNNGRFPPDIGACLFSALLLDVCF